MIHDIPQADFLMMSSTKTDKNVTLGSGLRQMSTAYSPIRPYTAQAKHLDARLQRGFEGVAETETSS
jgi:hypothetical protein